MQVTLCRHPLLLLTLLKQFQLHWISSVDSVTIPSGKSIYWCLCPGKSGVTAPKTGSRAVCAVCVCFTAEQFPGCPSASQNIFLCAGVGSEKLFCNIHAGVCKGMYLYLSLKESLPCQGHARQVERLNPPCSSHPHTAPSSNLPTEQTENEYIFLIEFFFVLAVLRKRKAQSWFFFFFPTKHPNHKHTLGDRTFPCKNNWEIYNLDNPTDAIRTGAGHP